MSMVSVCLPSDALLQHLLSYLGFSYLGHGVSLHGCSSKVQPLLLTLDERYLLTADLPDLQRGMASLGPPVPVQPPLLGRGLILDLGNLIIRLLWWLSGKESACQRRSKFDPWVRKIPWKRKWQPIPIFLPGKSHGQRSLVGFSS